MIFLNDVFIAFSCALDLIYFKTDLIFYLMAEVFSHKV